MQAIALKLSILGFVAAFSTTANATIVGTSHDFSAEAWDVEGEICNACHTPHNAISTMVPLWNHTTTTAVFTPYTSTGTLDATDVDATLGNESKACLSCHDGTVALDSYGGATGATTMTGFALVGNDLSNDHPVGFTYNAALATADGELEDPVTAASPITGSTGTIATDMLYGASNDQLECASCHDVHDNTNGSFLIASNAVSALCLSCHIK